LERADAIVLPVLLASLPTRSILLHIITPETYYFYFGREDSHFKTKNMAFLALLGKLAYICSRKDILIQPNQTKITTK